MDHLEPDPLLKPGAFIDPNPPSNGDSKPEPISDPPVHTDPEGGLDPNPVDGALTARPDWLPPTWKFVERVRTSGASAGSRDKYYLDPVTNRRFRSKKEVLFFLENGTPQPKGKRKNTTSDADNTPQSNSPAPKRKKSESKVKDCLKNFNFNDAPPKVKWELADVYEGAWRPLNNGVDRVPESAKQEWAAAFTYLTLQNSGAALF